MLGYTFILGANFRVSRKQCPRVRERARAPQWLKRQRRRGWVNGPIHLLFMFGITLICSPSQVKLRKFLAGTLIGKPVGREVTVEVGCRFKGKN